MLASGAPPPQKKVHIHLLFKEQAQFLHRENDLTLTAQSSRLGWPDEVSSISARSPISVSRFPVRPWRSCRSVWRGMRVVAWLTMWRLIWGWRTEVESSDALVGKTGSRRSQARGWMRKQRRAEGLWLRCSERRHVVPRLKRSKEKLWEWLKNSVH